MEITRPFWSVNSDMLECVTSTVLTYRYDNFSLSVVPKCWLKHISCELSVRFALRVMKV